MKKAMISVLVGAIFGGVVVWAATQSNFSENTRPSSIISVAEAKGLPEKITETPEKIIQCTREMSNYEYLECVQNNNEIYEKQINSIYSELKIKLKDEDNDDITLTKSQNAWTAYRDNYCKLANSTKVVGYPTGAGVVLYAEECINSFNENRLKELNTLKSDIEEFEKE